MKSRILFIAITLFMALGSSAQNLVPNYSFEDTLKCVNGVDAFTGYVADWTCLDGSGGVCYMTGECSFPLQGVPYNLVGFQYAHTGVSYAEVQTFANEGPDSTYPYSGTGFNNYRTYIQVKLMDSLKSGKQYFVTFFVSLADSSCYACSDIGAYFSDSLLKWTSYAKTYLTPQISNNSKIRELSDTMNWTKISGSLMAKGGEKYIVIGNFKNDSLSSIRYLGQRAAQQSSAYYYIDDVTVSPDSNYADSLESVNELKVESEKLKVYPNPSKGMFNFQLQNVNEPSQLEVYNMMGERIYSQEFSIFN